ncbi:endonuclease VII domain-containing protein [Streptomyces sp. NPDC049577]|uniref:endonuclease VII domain-containing protein n=1 Tax=Streptomyces sp. NPDC049577 TaxID=3155153 RepID=UPI003442EFD9
MPETSLKRCSACREVKPISDFYMQSTNPTHRSYGRPQGRCKVCVRKKNSAHQRKNYDPEKYRRWRLKTEFGITAEDYDRWVAMQHGRCAICNGPPSGRWKRLHVDHCHQSGHVRGLLCQACNRGLGYLNDSPELLRRAARYLMAGESK